MRTSTPAPKSKIEKALLALTNVEQSMDIPKSIFKKEKDLNVLINAIINAIRKSKKKNPCLL